MSGDQCQITGGVLAHACAEKDKLSPPRQLNGGCIEGYSPGHLFTTTLRPIAHGHGPVESEARYKEGSSAVIILQY